MTINGASNPHMCRSCGMARPLLERLCKACYKKLYREPFEREILNCHQILATLNANCLEIDRKIIQAEAAEKGDTFSVHPQQFYHCGIAGCTEKFSFRSDRDKHQDKPHKDLSKSPLPRKSTNKSPNTGKAAPSTTVAAQSTTGGKSVQHKGRQRQVI